MRPAARLRSLLAEPRLLQVPGCFDALSARLVERAGFRAAYMTGFGVSASALGLPDLGLISFAEMAERAAAMASAVSIPVLADADTGFGNAANVYRTVRSYARAGVAGIQLEDQVAPKRCGHTAGKEVVAVEEMIEKLRAAAAARSEEDIVVVARTDARAVLGFEDALERCRAYAGAGADVVFLEAPRSEEELGRVPREVGVPCLVNVVEGGMTPLVTRERLEEMGYRIAIYPVTLLFAAVSAMRDQLAQGDGGFLLWNKDLTFEELRKQIGFPEAKARAQSFRVEEEEQPRTDG